MCFLLVVLNSPVSSLDAPERRALRTGYATDLTNLSDCVVEQNRLAGVIRSNER